MTYDAQREKMLEAVAEWVNDDSPRPRHIAASADSDRDDAEAGATSPESNPQTRRNGPGGHFRGWLSRFRRPQATRRPVRHAKEQLDEWHPWD